MVEAVPFIVPVVNVHTLQTKIRTETTGSPTQVQKKPWRLVTEDLAEDTAFPKNSLWKEEHLRDRIAPPSLASRRVGELESYPTPGRHASLPPVPRLLSSGAGIPAVCPPVIPAVPR